MKLYLVVLCSALAATVSAELKVGEKAYIEPLRFYHETVGIAKAERIRRAEEAELAGGSASANSDRIAGGSLAWLGQYPYMGGLVITLTTGATSVCGSTLISRERALTAAQCWWDGRNRARLFTLVLDSTRLFTGGDRIDTSNVEMHARYNFNTLDHDLAVIRFPYVYNWFVQPVALPEGDLSTNLFTGEMAYATGFGATGQWASGAIRPDQQLSHVQLEIVSNPVCRNYWGSFVIASMLCTSGSGGRSTCPGDTGGPLVVKQNNRDVLVGITSFFPTSGCQSVRPAGYTRVTSFLPWIRTELPRLSIL